MLDFNDDDGSGDDLLLEAYIDDDLSADDRRALERRLADEPELAGRLQLARQVQEGLRGLPLKSCPPEVVQRVWERVERPGPIARLRAELRRALGGWSPARHPAWLGMALGLALTVAVIRPWDGLSTPSMSGSANSGIEVPIDRAAAYATATGSRSSPPTPQDVAAAEEEVKLALAYLGKLGRTAGSSVRRLTLDGSAAEIDAGERP